MAEFLQQLFAFFHSWVKDIFSFGVQCFYLLFSESFPLQVLVSIPIPQADEDPTIAWPTSVASEGTCMGMKEASRGNFLQDSLLQSIS